LTVEVNRAQPGATHDGRITVEIFIRAWLTRRIGGIRERTWARYAELAENQIIPRLGAIPLRRLGYLDLEGLYAGLLSDGGRNGEGLAPRTVLHVHRLCHQIGKAAMKAGHLATNPAALAQAPRVEDNAPPALSESQKQDYLAIFTGHRFEAAAVLLLSCGLRRGELLGLTWQEGAARYEEGRIEITKTWQEIRLRDPKSGTPKTKLELVSTKTAAGRRTVHLPPAAVEALRRHWVRQHEEYLKFHWGKPTFLFTSPDTGKPWRPSKFSRAFTDVAAAGGLKLWPHLLRHTHLTDLMRDNVHPKIAQHRAGHTRISTTLDLYSHVADGMQDAAVRSAEAALSRARSKP
jgi:integrase